jgi:hypothetical protein
MMATRASMSVRHAAGALEYLRHCARALARVGGGGGQLVLVTLGSRCAKQPPTPNSRRGSGPCTGAAARRHSTHARTHARTLEVRGAFSKGVAWTVLAVLAARIASRC